MINAFTFSFSQGFLKGCQLIFLTCEASVAQLCKIVKPNSQKRINELLFSIRKKIS